MVQKTLNFKDCLICEFCSEMGVGNTYLCVLYENHVKPQVLTDVLLPGAPIWDTCNPNEAANIQLFLNYNQQIRLEVTV